MILNITVHTTADQLIITIPQAGLAEYLPNIIAINEDDKICAIGQEAGEMYQTDTSEQWSEKYQIRFINPFELEKHGASYAVAILSFYIDQAIKKMRRDLILSRLFYRCDYDLWLWNYDNLLAETRDEFVYSLRKDSFWKIRSVSVNGKMSAPSAEFIHKKRVEIRQNQIADFTSRLFPVILMGLLFLVLRRLIPMGIWTTSTPFDGYIVGILVVFIALLVLAVIFGGLFLGAVSWMYVMRYFLPVEVIRSHMPSLGILDKLINSFADKILGGNITKGKAA